MLVKGSQIAQSRPAGTAAVSGFTADLHTEITRIVVCNTTGTAAAYSIYHDDDGSTYDQTTALFYAANIGANSTVIIDAEGPSGGFAIKADGTLGVQTDTANALTFTIYGVSENIAD